jgi:hypothetical protein
MRRNLDNPSTTFFWNDWDNEPGMKFCSLAAQGLWVKMLSLAARSREYGVILIGDHASLRGDLPGLLSPACGEAVTIIDELIDQLIKFKVASIDQVGRVINRRMVAEGKLSADRAAAGRAGAAVTNQKRQTLGSAAGKANGNLSVKSRRAKPMGNARQAGINQEEFAPCGRQNSNNHADKRSPSSFFHSSSVSEETEDARALDPLPKITFSVCLTYLLETGRKESGVRSLLGRWAQQYGHSALHHAVEQARLRAKGDPVPYIEACLKRSGSSSQSQSTDALGAQP